MSIPKDAVQAEKARTFQGECECRAGRDPAAHLEELDFIVELLQLTVTRTHHNRRGSGRRRGCWLAAGVMGGEGFARNTLLAVVADDKALALLLRSDCCNPAEDIVFTTTV
uniref:Uncharacterized protein n=1 Tax=Physcomitrium patens TaxID=3218 RepID=A0A2K1IWP0_PHYPA|nr:hypothetical protein PHYPA_023501 [Physcomitrium patens]